MLKKSVFVVALLASLLGYSVQQQSFGAGGKGGGSVKPSTIRWAGYITAKAPAVGGVAVTLGTSYYATGVALVTPASKIKINGVSQDYTAADLRIGDFAEVDVTWPNRVAVKLEAIGAR